MTNTDTGTRMLISPCAGLLAESRNIVIPSCSKLPPARLDGGKRLFLYSPRQICRALPKNMISPILVEVLGELSVVNIIRDIQLDAASVTDSASKPCFYSCFQSMNARVRPGADVTMRATWPSPTSPTSPTSLRADSSNRPTAVPVFVVCVDRATPGTDQRARPDLSRRYPGWILVLRLSQ
ncbi:hypothetical protein RRG08_066933 [Elysia crispata]|uniref:Uncharacterized protein n=1 Tax=Elysia crispata TaxID=231223 RepID=A0AAE1E279_9GAST|nr:hypothetical protein RRG08_066933 [Elysia crispata]